MLIGLNITQILEGYSLDHIRNELYGIKIGNDGIYMFGGTEMKEIILQLIPVLIL